MPRRENPLQDLFLTAANAPIQEKVIPSPTEGFRRNGMTQASNQKDPGKWVVQHRRSLISIRCRQPGRIRSEHVFSAGRFFGKGRGTMLPHSFGRHH
jgi:hypothetical protein